MAHQEPPAQAAGLTAGRRASAAVPQPQSRQKRLRPAAAAGLQGAGQGTGSSSQASQGSSLHRVGCVQPPQRPPSAQSVRLGFASGVTQSYPPASLGASAVSGSSLCRPQARTRTSSTSMDRPSSLNPNSRCTPGAARVVWEGRGLAAAARTVPAARGHHRPGSCNACPCTKPCLCRVPTW